MAEYTKDKTNNLKVSDSLVCVQENGMSSYEKLLLQVENLTVENDSLKEKLNSNTCQISRLCLEASNLKEIILELTKSLNSQKNVDIQNNSQINSNLNLKFGQFLSVSMGPANASPVNDSLNSFSFVDYELNVKQKIMFLQQQRCSILEVLKKEESIKETCMSKLKSLNEKLNSIVENDETTVNNKVSNQFLENNISETPKKIEKDLGTYDVMKFQNYLEQLHVIENNINKLESELNESVEDKSCCAAGETILTMENICIPESIDQNLDDKTFERNVFVHLDMIRKYCNALHFIYPSLHASSCVKDHLSAASETSLQNEILSSVQFILQHSYYKRTRMVLNKLGSLYCIAELLILDHGHYDDSTKTEWNTSSLHQLTGLTLTNLSFGDSSNKTILINMQQLLETVVERMKSNCENVQQAMYSLIRNLSWQPDEHDKDRIEKAGFVKILCEQMTQAKSELTIINILNALWNLSSLSEANQKKICSEEGTLSFLCSLLKNNSSSKSNLVIENASGVLRNVSAVAAQSDQYRQTLRNQNLLQVLVSQLTSSSITMVSNACGILWNLSASDKSDQQKLRDLGAVPILRKLVQSKYALIAERSNETLKNLLAGQTNKMVAPTSAGRKEFLPLQDGRVSQTGSHHSEESFHSVQPFNRSNCLRNKQPAMSNCSLLTSQSYFNTKTNSNDFSNESSLPSSSSGMPTDLAKKLQDTYNDYAMEDDNPINYSLQYKETELGSLPVSRSSSFPSNHQNTVSSSDQEKIKKSNLNAPHDLYEVPLRPKVDSSMEEKLMFADKHFHDGPDETPTDFGAIYAEGCVEDYTLQQYSTTNDNNNECVKKYSVEDTPVCFSNRSSLSDLHNNVNSQHASVNKFVRINDPISNVEQGNKQVSHSNEEDDKFSGAMTPRNYFNKSNRQSGAMTPKHGYQETPMMMYSPNGSSRSSLGSVDPDSFHSDVSSEFEFRLQSGHISPSDLPDSPGQSMPQSRCRSPKNDRTQNSAAICNAESKAEQYKSTYSNLRGLSLIEKAHALSPAYLSRLPPSDETKCFTMEPAMSVMTEFSDLSIDGEKIAVLQNKPSRSTLNQTENVADNASLSKSSVVRHAGYVTSLPSSDEIKSFCFEGSQSPFVGLSEISALHSHNKGFQKDSLKFKTPKSSNRNSYTSRSSATGASVPAGPVSQPDDIKPFKDINKKDSEKSSEESSIKYGVEMVVATNDGDSNKRNKNSKQNDYASADQTSNEDPLFSKKIITTAGYVPSMPSTDEILNYQLEEGTISPMTTLSEINILKTFNQDFEKPNKHQTNVSGEKSDVLSSAKTACSTASNLAADYKISCPDDITNSIDDASDDDFLKSSSDDDNLLKQLIKSAEPKNRTTARPKSSKTSSSSNRRDKSSSYKLNNKHNSKLTSSKKSSQSSDHRNHQSSSFKLDTRDRIAAADSRLNGITISDYIENLMEDAPNAGGKKDDTDKPGHQVKQTAETLETTYSVMKHLHFSEKTQSEFEKNLYLTPSMARVETCGPSVMGLNMKTSTFLPNKPTSFATEGTPIEISRCTSLSDLTIDSDQHNYDFAALKNKMSFGKAEGKDLRDQQLSDSRNISTTMVSIEKEMKDMNLNQNKKDKATSVNLPVDTSIEQENLSRLTQVVEPANGCESSLSSIRSDDDESNLLQACITSAMPVARKDFAPAIPPNQLVEENRAYIQQHPDFLIDPLHDLKHTNLPKTSVVRNNLKPNILPVIPRSDNDLCVFETHHDAADLSDPSSGSLILGGDAKTLNEARNRAKIASDRFTSSGEKPSVTKDRRKSHRAPTSGRSRDNTFHSRITDDSSRSSSYKCKRDLASESSRSTCNKCRSLTGKIPTSVEKIEGRLSRRYRNTASSYTSKPRGAACGHHVFGKSTRSRSAHAGYYHGVTRMYPPVNDSVMLNGVASMAARGDMVHCDRMQQLVPVNFPLSVFQRPVLLNLQDHPNPALLERGVHSIPAYQLVRGHPTSLSKKKQQNEKKKKGLKSRLKKLISPSNPTKSAHAKKIVARHDSNLSEESKSGSSSAWSKKNRVATPLSPITARSSSLSLSTSSDDSDHSVKTYPKVQANRNIYPTASSITSNHIPKSPSAKARYAVKNLKLKNNPDLVESSSLDDTREWHQVIQ